MLRSGNNSIGIMTWGFDKVIKSGSNHKTQFFLTYGSISPCCPFTLNLVPALSLDILHTQSKPADLL